MLLQKHTYLVLVEKCLIDDTGNLKDYVYSYSRENDARDHCFVARSMGYTVKLFYGNYEYFEQIDG